jgi:raffinose/stachyose/melibiose transport system substrate-binding protein
LEEYKGNQQSSIEVREMEGIKMSDQERAASRSRFKVLLTAILLPLSLIVATSPSASAEPTVVNWWAWNAGGPVDDNPYIKAFEKANPDIKVVLRNLAYEDYKNALRLAVTTGEGPDVFGVQVGPLTDQYASSAENLSGYMSKSALGATWKKKLIGANQLVSGGKQVAAPWYISAAGLLWYNKTLFDKNKVAVPTDLASFKAACAKFKAVKINCFIHGAKDAWVNLDMFQAISNQLAPGDFYKAIKGEKKFNTPTYVKALSTWQSLFTTGLVQKGALGTPQYSDAYDSYMKGESAMIFLGSWQNPQMTKTSAALNAKTYAGTNAGKFVHMAVPMPGLVPNAKTGALFGGPDLGWAMSSSSKNKEAAWKWIEFLTIGEGQKIMGGQGNQPANISVPIDTSDFLSSSQKAVVTMQAKALATMIGQREIPNADVQKALADALSAVAAGTQTATAAAVAVQKAINLAYGL